MMIFRRISSEKGSIKKFYKHSSVKKHALGYQVFLDKHPLKTPLGTPFILKSELLALVISNEWETQEKYIKQFGMPLVMNILDTNFINMSWFRKAKNKRLTCRSNNIIFWNRFYLARLI